jgi:hypothetical protein
MRVGSRKSLNDQHFLGDTRGQISQRTQSKRTVVGDDVSVDSSDVIIDLSVITQGVYDRLSHHICPESIVDGKMGPICRDKAQSAVEIVGWMASFIQKLIVHG